MNISKIEAVLSLRPKAKLVINNEVIDWLDTEQTQPSEAEVTTEMSRLQAEYDAQAYARARTYPSIGDQLDMIFHAGLGGDEFQTAIQAVKDKYPK